MSDVSAGALQSFATAMLIIFEGHAEIEAMKVANEERRRHDKALAYNDAAFFQVQNGVIERTRQQLEWIR